MSTISVGDTPPPAPAVGDGWWDSVGGQLYLWFGPDPSGSYQWVAAVNQPGAPGPGVGPQGPPGTPGRPGRNSGDPILPVIVTPECEPFVCKTGLDALYDEVQLQLPGVTTDVVQLEAWRTIHKFFVDSTYRREHVYWRMDPGVVTLSFDPWDAHWRVSRFLGFSGGLNKPKFEPPGRLRDLTWPIPDNTRTGEVLLSLRPDCVDAPFDDDIWAMWYDAFVAGTLSRLFLQPGKPYTDPQMGRLKALEFRHGVIQARAHVQSQFITDGASWYYPYFALGRRH